MGLRNSTLVVVAVVSLAGVLSGCSGTGGRYDIEEGPQPGYEEFVADQYVEEDYEPSQAEIDDAMRESEARVREELGLGAWSCTYSPTYNDDWHDDVICSNGSDSHRPYLREWDSFVEEWELMESATEYEAELNAGG